MKSYFQVQPEVQPSNKNKRIHNDNDENQEESDDEVEELVENIIEDIEPEGETDFVPSKYKKIYRKSSGKTQFNSLSFRKQQNEHVQSKMFKMCCFYNFIYFKMFV